VNDPEELQTFEIFIPVEIRMRYNSILEEYKKIKHSNKELEKLLRKEKEEKDKTKLKNKDIEDEEGANLNLAQHHKKTDESKFEVLEVRDIL